MSSGNAYTNGGYVWRRANTRYGYTKSLIDHLDLYGTVTTGGIKHSFAVGAKGSLEKARRGSYVLATGSTISPRCNAQTVARYYCASLFIPNPNDPWVNYPSDTSSVPAPIAKGSTSRETQNDAYTGAIYAFASITLVDWAILNLGARYDYFKSIVTYPTTSGIGAAAGVVPVRLSRVDHLFIWQAGLVLKPTRETSVYRSYATAATPPNTLLSEGREDNAIPATLTTAANVQAF